MASSRLRSLLFGLWIAVLALGGAFAGVKLAQRNSVPADLPYERSAPGFLLASEATLPTAQLMGEETVPVSTTEIPGRGGSVVLFLDTECQPCRYAAGQWQNLIADGLLGDIAVLGISPSPRESIESFRTHLALDFPVYQDPSQTYMHRYGVDSFPWELIVDARGKVLRYTGDLREMGRPESLRDLR